MTDNLQDLEYYMECASDLIERDKDLRRVQKAMDRMANLSYELPSELKHLEWMRRVVSAAPYDAVVAGTRVLSGQQERLSIDPLSVLKKMPAGIESSNEAARKKANDWEYALSWQMRLAERRRAIMREDTTRSAIMYDEACVQVIHLPTQIKALEALGVDASRRKAALAGGQFAISVRNPQNVHSTWSDYMLESVLYSKVMETEDIIAFWGEKARELYDLNEKGSAPPKYILFDWVDYDSRVVWAIPGDDESHAGRFEDAIEIVREKWDYQFLPWAITIGGTLLDAEPDKQRRPLLYGVYRSENWITENIAKSLEMSQAIAESGRPRVKVEGPNPDSVQAEYGTPGGTWEVPPGHQVTDMAQPGLDPGLAAMVAQLEDEMMSGTLPRILITAEVRSRQTFSAYNMMVQQAMATLTPFKRVSERALAESYRLMLKWCEASGTTIDGYGKGEQYKITPEEIDPDNIFLDVALDPDIPLDRQQRIVSAIQMSRDLKYPTRRILEEIGETDPDGAIEEYAREQFFFAALGGQIQMIQAEASGALQQMAQQEAQQMAAAQTQQQSQQPAPGSPQGVPGQQGLGQMLNPAQGGTPPAQGAPGATFEGQTGQSRQGFPVSGPMG